MRQLTAASLLALAAACGKDSKFIDAGAPIDGAPIDGAGDTPAIDVPAGVDLGEVACGGSFEGAMPVENVGGVDLAFAITSSNPVFAVTPAEGTLPAGESIVFTLTAAVPAGAQAGVALTGDLTIATDALEPVMVGVSVTPRGGTLLLTPSPVSFGDVEVGLSGSQDVTIQNTGNQPITVDFTLAGGSDFGFDVDSVDLAAGGEVTGTVTYTPDALEDDSADIAIAITGTTCGTQPAVLALSGTGAPDGGVLVTGNVAFGSQSCTSPSATRDVTLTNDGSVAATFTAGMLADPEGDHLRYTVSPSSGSIPVGESRTVTVTRLAPSLPFQPRSVDATLRVTTIGQLTQDHDLPVTQSIDGPYLEASAASLDFGFAPVGETLGHTVTITNTGTTGTGITYTESGAHFTVPQSGASIGPGPAQVTFTASYAPSALGDTSGDVAVAATPASCSGATSVALAAGTGPWAEIADSSVQRTCSPIVPTAGGDSVAVSNPGNQARVLSGCVETSSTDVDPGVSPDPATVDAGAGAFLFLVWSMPSPPRSGTTVATVTCDSNEKFHTQRSFLVTRTIYGADLLLEYADGDLGFTCGTAIFTEKQVRITNTGNQDAFLISDHFLPTPLYGLGGAFNVGSGGGVSTALGVGMGSGSCAPGTGYAGVNLSSADVCSVTPSDRLDVTLSP